MKVHNNGKFPAYKEMMAADCEHQQVHPRGKGREETEAGKPKTSCLTRHRRRRCSTCSKRTMQRMRTNHRIEYVVIRGKLPLPPFPRYCGYWRDNTVRNEEGTIDTLFHNTRLAHGRQTKRKEDIGHGTAHTKQLRGLVMQKLMERLDRQDELLAGDEG